MPTFEYHAIRAEGDEEKSFVGGVVRAKSRHDAKEKLRERGLKATMLKRARACSPSSSTSKPIFASISVDFPPVSSGDRRSFFSRSPAFPHGTRAPGARQAHRAVITFHSSLSLWHDMRPSRCRGVFGIACDCSPTMRPLAGRLPE